MALLTRTVFRGYPAIICRSFRATVSVQDDAFKKLIFKLEGYNKFGLLKDDLLNELSPDVGEAIRRLPEEEQMQRAYRAIRASQAELNNSILPEEQWTKYEDNHHYLQPYLKEVRQEMKEREDWEANH